MSQQDAMKTKRSAAAETNDPALPMKRKEFESELRRLQVKLVRLQTWVKATGTRVIVIFEGRDTTG
jgi:polyphosphate kinase